MVERDVWDVEAGSSRLSTPTIIIRLYAAALRTQRKLMDTCGFESCQPGHKLFDLLYIVNKQWKLSDQLFDLIGIFHLFFWILYIEIKVISW